MPVYVASYGAGTNSTAMLTRWVREGRRLDLVLFADTHGERPETYEYVGLFSDWLVRHGAPAVTRVAYTNKAGEEVGLEEDCLRKATLPSKAFGYSGCSLKWKIEPQEKFCNNWPPAQKEWSAGRKIVKLIGYDADEPERAHRRAAADKKDPKYVFEYPLLGWDMGRDECVAEIRSVGLPLPGKSACFFCPSTRKPEIRDLRAKHPDLLRRALAMEMHARLGETGLTHIGGLGRRLSWQAFVCGETTQEADEPVSCGCYDG